MKKTIKSYVKISVILCCLLLSLMCVWSGGVSYRTNINNKVYADTLSSLKSFQEGIASLEDDYESIVIPKGEYSERGEEIIQDNSRVSALSLEENQNLFANKHQSIIDSFSGAPREIVEDYCKENGLNLLQTENSYQIYEKFALKRLIVDGNIKKTYGAVKDISGYLNYHILCYNSIDATKLAYSKIKKDGFDVWEDGLVSTASYADTDYSSTYSSHKSWGAEYCDIGGINAYINDNSYAQQNIAVAVLDSGINTAHEMFQNRFFYDENNDIVGSTKYTTTYTYSGVAFEDDNGHGTHVAGTIVDLTPENVKIIPIKVLNSLGSGADDEILAGLASVEEYSTKYTIACVNMSLGGGYTRDRYNKYTSAFASLRNKNILSVVAAGNKSADVSYHLPAYCNNAITVSAVKERSASMGVEFDEDYSNFGNQVNISAPGTSVNSAYIASSNNDAQNLKGKNIYSKLTGTSMAAPHVAGAVALLTLYKLNTTYTSDDIENLLYDCAIDLGTEGKDIYYGNGFLNLRYFNVPKINDEVSLYNDGVKIDLSKDCFETTTTSNITASTNDSSYVFYYSLNLLPSKKNEIMIEPSIQFKRTSITNLYIVGYKIVEGEIVSRTTSKFLNLYYNSGNVEDYIELEMNSDKTGYIVFEYYGRHFTEINFNNIFKNKTIKEIGKEVFKKNSIIESIIFSDSITVISESAFLNCANLKNVYAPKVTKISRFAFHKCPLITNVVSDEVDIDPNGSIYLPEVSEFDSFIFAGCENLESVELNKLETLSETGNQFLDCLKLSTCILPNITSLPKYMFGFTSNLKTFNIGEKVASIGEGVFRESGIESITCDENNKNIYVDSNKGVYFEETVKIIARKNNESYTILDSYTLNGEQKQVTTLGHLALTEGNLIMKELVIPESIIYPDLWFAYNIIIDNLIIKAKNMVSDKYYNTVTDTVSPVFYKCSLNSIIIDSSVEVLPQRFFATYPKTPHSLQINSKSTTFGAYSLRFEDTKLDHLILNFDEQINESYLSMLNKDAGLNGITKLSSKSQIPASARLTNYYSNLKYEKFNSETGYYEYSATPSEVSNFNITLNISKGGYIQVNQTKYTTTTVISCEKGTNLTYSAFANNGYELSSHTIDGNSIPTTTNPNTIPNIQCDIAINVTFSPIEYSITYDYAGGTVSKPNPINYTIETETFTLNNPTKAGYTFLGWTGSNGDSPSKSVTIPKGSTGNKEYTANWQENQEMVSLTIPFSYIGCYETAVKIEYSIDGGKTRQVLKEKGDKTNKTLQIPKNKNLIFYLPYEMDDYPYVVLNMAYNDINGNDINDLPPKNYNHKKVDKEIHITFKNVSSGTTVFFGYYWFISHTYRKDGHDSIGGRGVPFSYTKVEKELFERFDFYEFFDRLGELESIIISEGETDEKIIDKNSENFEAIKEQGFYNLYYKEGESFRHSIVFKYVDTPQIYNIKISKMNNYGSISPLGENNVVSIEGGKDITFTFTPNKGYKVNAKLDGNSVEVSLVESGDKYEYTITSVSSDHTLEVTFDIITYKITYNFNGGTQSGTYKQSYTVSTAAFILPNPQRAGYTFLGWTGTDLNNQPTKNVKINKGSIGERTYIANWEIIEYSITYDYAGDSVSSTNPTKYTIETETFTLINPTKAGYTFLGWTGSNGDNPSKSVSIPKGSTGNKEYIANWQVIEYSITYDYAGGTVSSTNPTKYTIETETFTLNNPTRFGYFFLGWTGSNGNKCEKTLTIEKGSTGNVYYNANFGPKFYVIQYEYDGGSVLEENKDIYFITDETFTLNNPTKIGYEFAGWIEEGVSGVRKEVTIEKGTTGNKKFTATWELLIFPITIENGENGVLTCDKFENKIESGETKTIENMHLHDTLEFKVELEEKYRIYKVLVNNTEVKANKSSFKIEDIKSGMTIKVIYIKEIDWIVVLKYGGIGVGSLLVLIIIIVLIKKGMGGHRNKKRVKGLLKDITNSQQIKFNSEMLMNTLDNPYNPNQPPYSDPQNDPNSPTYLNPNDIQRVPPKTTYWNMNSASDPNFNGENNTNNHNNSNLNNSSNPNDPNNSGSNNN